jgi:hypothetical protein
MVPQAWCDLQAAGVYAEVRRLEPYQLLGMDWYSTSLWHLQREVELSALAQDLSQLDKSSPQVDTIIVSPQSTTVQWDNIGRILINGCFFSVIGNIN